jgi:hypothetical protein
MNIIKDERRPEFPRSERIMAKSIRHVSLDPESMNKRMLLPGQKQEQVLKVWRLAMPVIIDWLDKNDQVADLRHVLGPVIWNRDAPERLKRAFEDVPVDVVPQPVRRPPPPPPPPSNVIKMPTIGFQKAHE